MKSSDSWIKKKDSGDLPIVVDSSQVDSNKENTTNILPPSNVNIKKAALYKDTKNQSMQNPAKAERQTEVSVPKMIAKTYLDL